MDTVFGMYLQIILFVILPAAAYGAIFQKAGYSPWIGLVMLLPIVNLIILVWFATTTWPLELGYERATARDSDSAMSDSAWEYKMAIRKGLALEKRGHLREALTQFNAVATGAVGLPLAGLAQGHATRLRKSLGESSG
jgi:hypothetical protein